MASEQERDQQETEGPGSITVDEPTETSLDPEDDDLETPEQ